MVPVAALHFSIKTQAHTHPAAVARKELDVLRVLTVFERIGATTGSEKLTRGGVDGRPLEALSGEQLDRLPGGRFDLDHLTALVAAGDPPVPCQGTRTIVGPLPGTGLPADAEREQPFFDGPIRLISAAHFLLVGGIVLNSTTHQTCFHGAGTSFCMDEFLPGDIETAQAVIIIDQDQCMGYTTLLAHPGARGRFTGSIEGQRPQNREKEDEIFHICKGLMCSLKIGQKD